MRKLLLLVALLVGVSLVAGACDAPVSGYAAQVNGATIDQSSLQATLAAAAANKPYACQLATSGINESGSAAGSQSYDTRFADIVLRQLIEIQVLTARLRHDGVAPTPFAAQLATSEIDSIYNPQASSTGQPSQCQGPGSLVYAEFPSSYQQQLLTLYEDQDLLAAEAGHFGLTSASVHNYELAHGGLPQERCISVIEVTSKATASVIASALHQGASFAVEARNHSVNTQTAAQGGQIACVTDAQLPQLLPAPLLQAVQPLAVGQPSAPISYQGVYLLFEVTKETTAPVQTDAELLVEQWLPKAEAIINGEILPSAHVSIDPAYGSWQRLSSGWDVVPPKAPASALLINPVAAGATGATGAAGAAAGATGAATGGAGATGATGAG